MQKSTYELNNNLTNYSSVIRSKRPVYTIFNVRVRAHDRTSINIMILADFINFQVLDYKFSLERFTFLDVIELIEENRPDPSKGLALYFANTAPYTKKDLFIYYEKNNILPSCYKKENEILQSRILKDFIKIKLKYCTKPQMENLLSSWKFSTSEVLSDYT